MDFITHLGHLLQFDGVLHWCFLITIVGFLTSLTWGIVRILLPLRQLVKQAASMMDGNLPSFDQECGGIREIEYLRRSLQHMIEQIDTAQKREITYRNAITESQENERTRIAREIHDDTIQSLVLVTHNIERAAHSARNTESQTHEHLENARAQLIGTIDSLRQLIANLRPTILDELGLVTAIEVLCEKHQALEFSVMGDIYEMDQTHELTLFRAAQEAIHNAVRHAHAHHIRATLAYSQTAVTLEICDDGVGFQIPRQLQEFSLQGHYGLIGIRERILHLGGHLDLISQVAGGTRVIVTVPISPLALVAA